MSDNAYGSGPQPATKLEEKHAELLHGHSRLQKQLRLETELKDTKAELAAIQQYVPNASYLLYLEGIAYYFGKWIDEVGVKTIMLSGFPDPSGSLILASNRSEALRSLQEAQTRDGTTLALSAEEYAQVSAGVLSFGSIGINLPAIDEDPQKLSNAERSPTITREALSEEAEKFLAWWASELAEDPHDEHLESVWEAEGGKPL